MISAIMLNARAVTDKYFAWRLFLRAILISSLQNRDFSSFFFVFLTPFLTCQRLSLAAICMENKFQNGLKDVINFLSKFIP